MYRLDLLIIWTFKPLELGLEVPERVLVLCYNEQHMKVLGS